MQDACKNIYEYNIDKKRRILIVFDDTIADMINNKKQNLIVTELFIRGRNWIFLLLLLENRILRFQKLLD